jgi:hypothetical protein
VSAFERFAVQRVLDKAHAAGVHVPDDVSHINACLVTGSYPARAWAAAHPDPGWVPCCWGSMHDPGGCTCWEPVFEVEQQPPRPPANPGDIEVAASMCADCAFRPGSPERATTFEKEALFALADEGTPFWCHQGMRRPDRWVHPDGRVVPGDPDDWTPAQLGPVAFRADGSPALLCAGWAARAGRAAPAPAPAPARCRRGRALGRMARTLCPVCGRDTPLREDGRPFRHQQISPGGQMLANVCPGGGRAPRREAA